MGAAPRGRSRSRSRSRAAAGCPGPPRSPAGEGDAKALLHSLAQQSFDHRDFANPKAETCWLSCLFQALWHSVAFHAAFEAFLAPARCAAGGAGSLLEALQQTWASYKQEAGADGGEAAGERRLVPPQKLAEAFGEGYGDMSDALSAILQELSRSQDTGARAVSDILAVVPVPTEADDLPTPGLAWRQLEQWQATAAPLVAVDLSFDRLPPDDSEKLAQLWLPRSAQGAGEASADLGGRHRLVALVCYMPLLRHYVAFCSRGSDRARCLFFNDLPGLTEGAPRELAWREAPELCRRYAFSPRLALYESLPAAEKFVASAQDLVRGGAEARGAAAREVPLGPGLVAGMCPQARADFDADLRELGATRGVTARLGAGDAAVELRGEAGAVEAARAELGEMLAFYFPGR